MDQATKLCADCDQTKESSDFHRRSASKDGLDSCCKMCRRARKAAYYAANRERILAEQRQRRSAGEWGILRRPPRLEPDTVDKPCTTCGVVKPYTEFNRCTVHRDGLQPCCRACEKVAKRARYLANRDEILTDMRRRHAANPDPVRRRARAWARANPERVRARVAAWRQANPDRVKRYIDEFNLRNPGHVRRRTQARRARLRNAFTLPFTEEQLQQRLSMFVGCWMCGGPKEAVDHVKPLVAGGAHILSNQRPICHRCNSSKSGRWPFPTLPYFRRCDEALTA